VSAESGGLPGPLSGPATRTGQAALAGRVALVTGAAKGIGAAAARQLAAAGAAVLLADTDQAAAAAAARDLTAAGGTAAAAHCDVRDFAQVSAACERAASRFGPVDLLVANAGVGDYSRLSDGDPGRWQALLDVNVMGVVHAVRAVLPGMKERLAGDVIIMASIAGRESWVGEPVYIASKHALVGLGSSLRQECAPAGVRVTLIEPAIVDTPLVRSTAEGRAELAVYAALTPDDVARAVVFAAGQPPGVCVSELVIRAVGAEA
jgi:NADP-dependent 3-hydroxy acid dehydrogenase YdfG